MTRPPKDTSKPGHASQPKIGDDKIARLEQALAEARARNSEVEARLADHKARLKTLGNGREESMRQLAEAREQLRRMTIERDELRQQFARVDGMQTATAALPDEPATDGPQNPDTLPSIEELMLSLQEMPGARPSGHRDHADARKDPSQEMLSPEIVFPERYAPTARSTGTTGSTDAQIKCVLVLLDAEQPMKFPLHKAQMVIGRADSADIQIDSHFLSRQHARVTLTDAGVVIEDVESKNGIKINSKLTSRQILRHGDLLSLGGLCLRFLDTAADDSG